MAFEIFKLFGTIMVNNEQANESIQKTEEHAEGVGKKLLNGVSTAAKWGAGIAVAAGTAAVALGVKSVASADEFQKALNQLQVTTGTTNEQMKGLGEVVKNVYGNNFGESFEDVADSVGIINKSLGLQGDQLQNITQLAIGFSDSFDVEVGESARSARTLMDQFGVSAEEAYNLMVQGEQSGLDYSDEFLDSINEYSVHFKQLGLDSEDMFNAFLDGAENGAFKLDSVGDSVKELGIIVKEGSGSEALTTLGLNADEVRKKFNQGGSEAKEAFYSIFTALGKVDDQTKLNTLGTELMGTKFEDLGKDSIIALGNMSDEFNKSYNAAQNINSIKYNSFSEALSGIGRLVETNVFIPIGQTALPTLTKFANWFASEGQQHLKAFSDVVISVLPFISSAFSDAFNVITGILSNLESTIGVIIEPITKRFQDFFVIFNEGIVGSDAGIIGSFGVAIKEAFGIDITPFTDGLTSALQWIMDNGASVVGAIVGFGTAMLVFQNLELIMGFVNGIQTAIFVFQNLRGAVNLAAEAQALFNIVMEANPFGLIATAIGVAVGAIIYLWNTNQGFRNFWITVWNEITTIFSGVIAVIMPLFNNIASYISSLWNQVGGFGGIWNSIWSEVMILFNTVVAFLTPLFLSIQNLIQTIWNPLSYVVIPLIQYFKSVIMNEFNTIKGIITNVMSVIQFIITTAISLISANWSNIWNLINNLTASIFNNIRNYITTTINSISSIISGVLGVIHGIFTGNLNEISSSVGRIFNGIVGLIANPLNTARGIVSDAVSAIVGFFSNIRIPAITLPHISLPHFSINGHFSLNPPSIPTLGVDWYADGGILTKPTMFGMNGNRAMVGGEAGPEAVLPLGGFYAQLDKNFDRMINAFLTQKIVLNNAIYMDKTAVGRSVADIVLQENNFRKL